MARAIAMPMMSQVQLAKDKAIFLRRWEKESTMSQLIEVLEIKIKEKLDQLRSDL